MKIKFVFFCLLLSSLVIYSCKDDETSEPIVQPSLTFDKIVTVTDGNLNFKLVLNNPSNVLIEEISVEYTELIEGAVATKHIIETNTEEGSRTIEVNLELEVSKKYKLTPFFLFKSGLRINAESTETKTGSPRWSTLKSFPGKGRTNTAIFAIGSKVYVGLGISSNYETLKDFWEYDTSTDAWKQLSDFPGGARFGVVSFSLNGKGYVGGGTAKYDDRFALLDFWQYTPATDSWIQTENLPTIQGDSYIASTFTSSDGSGAGYYGTGVYRGFLVDKMYRFNGSVWNEIAPLPLEASGCISFIIGNRLFVGLGSTETSKFNNRIFMYDPLSDGWKEMNMVSGLNNEKSEESPRNASFTIGQNAYVVGPFGDVVKYDVLTDQWSQDQDAELISEDMTRESVVGSQMVTVGAKAYGGLGTIVTLVDGFRVYTSGNDWMVYDPSK